MVTKPHTLASSGDVRFENYSLDNDMRILSTPMCFHVPMCISLVSLIVGLTW